MASSSAFANRYANDALIVSASTGVLPSVILAQWIDETASGTSTAFTSGWNFAGITYAGLASFPTEQAGRDAYIQTLNQQVYDPVRQAVGWQAQAQALGRSPWAASHYDYADYVAAGQPADGSWTPPNPGADLISLISQYNLTVFDAGSAAGGGTAGTTPTSQVGSLGTPLSAPAAGLSSALTAGDLILNGTTLDVDVAGALSNVALSLTAAGASTLTVTLQDPGRGLINNPAFAQQSTLIVDGATWSLVSVVKQANDLTVTFEPWVVAALRRATGALTISPDTMTRVAFAEMLVSEVQGAKFLAPPKTSLLHAFSSDPSKPGIADNYGYSTAEQLSRGTIQDPLESSWTCLLRLAAEIQWRCFEAGGVIYFAPDAWLMQLPSALTLTEGVDGVSGIDGEWDIGQPLSTVQASCVVGGYLPAPGQVATVRGLGVLAGRWLVTGVERSSLFLPDVTLTLSAPQPSLPEPLTGGAQPAVGQGFNLPGQQQTPAGTNTASSALAAATSQLGVPYVWGGESPGSGFDCSGLMQWAYSQAGVNIPRTSEQQFAMATPVPAGGANLRPGDLVFFGTGTDASHVGMFVSYESASNTARMINAEHAGAPVMYDTFTPDVGTRWGGDVYMGAIRPAP